MRRELLLTLTAVVVLSLAVGTSGFSAAQLERGVSVSVSDSDAALVALYDPGEQNPPSWVSGEAASEPDPSQDGETPVVYVRNQFENKMLTVSLEPDSDTIRDAESVRLDSGATAPIHADVDCVGDTENVPLTVVANGHGVTTRIEFTVTVDCHAPTETPTPSDSTPTGS